MADRVPKVILITGASSGIGAALAHEVAARGDQLVVTARRADRLEALVETLGRAGIEALSFVADLADRETPGRLLEATLGRFGRLDVLVNNAGIGLPHLFGAADPDAIRRQVEVNLTAPLVLTRLALPHLFASRGTVINIGSAITSVPNAALGAYGATKAGLAYWNDALRREVHHRGVRVCLVEPGPIATEFFDAMDIPPREGPRLYNPMRDPPPRVLTAPVEVAARRIARLIDSPRRRTSVLRRVVWPYRVVGGLFQVAPWLGDLALRSTAIHLERTTDARQGMDRRTSPDRFPKAEVASGESRGPEDRPEP